MSVHSGVLVSVHLHPDRLRRRMLATAGGLTGARALMHDCMASAR
jgi:hypothetical protein